MAFDTKAKRAATLGYGLACYLVLPPPDGAISVADAGHALSAYRFTFTTVVAAFPASTMPTSVTFDG